MKPDLLGKADGALFETVGAAFAGSVKEEDGGPVLIGGNIVGDVDDVTTVADLTVEEPCFMRHGCEFTGFGGANEDLIVVG